MTQTEKRMRATERILLMMREFDKITRTTDKRDIKNFNEKYWTDKLSKMSDAQFTQFMKSLKDKTDHLTIEVNMSGDTDMNLNEIYALADKVKVKLREHIIFRHLNPANPDNPVVTSSPALIVLVPVRKLQQMLDKKNTASGDIDSYNPLTGQVTGESRSAGISDAQTFALVATNQKNTLKELLGPRADDMESKMKMLREIETTGQVTLKDLNIKTSNKQALKTADMFLRGAGFITDLLDPIEDK